MASEQPSAGTVRFGLYEVQQFCVECVDRVTPWVFGSPTAIMMNCPDCGARLFRLEAERARAPDDEVSDDE